MKRGDNHPVTVYRTISCRELDFIAKEKIGLKKITPKLHAQTRTVGLSQTLTEAEATCFSTATTGMDQNHSRVMLSFPPDVFETELCVKTHICFSSDKTDIYRLDQSDRMTNIGTPQGIQSIFKTKQPRQSPNATSCHNQYAQCNKLQEDFVHSENMLYYQHFELDRIIHPL